MPVFPITDILSIYHFQRSSNTESYSPTPTWTNINATITPAGTDIQAVYGGMEGYQAFEIYIYDPTLTIKNGDKLVSAAGVTYLVAGVAETVNNRYLAYQKIVGRVVT